MKKITEISSIEYRYIIVFILLLKILLMACFSSAYQDELFMPFLRHFAQNIDNPWQYYYSNELNLDAFPYHPLMLYLLTPSMFVINLFNIENVLISNFIFKIPLFVADIVIFYVLLKLVRSKNMNVVLYYFCNPIIIYAIYIHSQLDIIPMALLLLGIYKLSLEKPHQSAIMIGLALATKLHILVALPILFLYLQKKYKTKDLVIFILIVVGIFAFFDLPFITSVGFKNMVLFNPKQSLLFDSFLSIGQLKFLLPIAAIAIVYIHFFNQNQVNKDLLLFYFGVLYTATIFFIYPAPAWYVWLVPFISIYFINSDNQRKSKIFYGSFSIAYLFFFVFFYQPDYNDILFYGTEVNLKFQQLHLANISFTILLVLLLAVMYAFYKYGIKSNSIYN